MGKIDYWIINMIR